MGRPLVASIVFMDLPLSVSLLFLEHLNANQSGPFRRWLDSCASAPRIAWYPSAGAGLRDLLYLQSGYRDLYPGSGYEPNAPELFLHTDYSLCEAADFLDRSVLHHDPRTEIRVVSREELPRCELPIYPDLVAFGANATVTHRVIFFQVVVRSLRLGVSQVPLLYVCAENAAFCAHRLLPLQATITHLVQVRYGHSLGGGLDSPGWLLSQLDTLGVEILVSDGCERRDYRARNPTFDHFPALRSAPANPAAWNFLRRLPHASWSGYGPVSWWRLDSTYLRHRESTP